MPRLNERFQHDGFYLIPGPATPEELMYTHAIDDFEEYSYEVIANAILSHSGTHETHPPEPDWSEWRARWSSGNREILIDMFPDTDHFESLETGEPIWSGGGLECHCLVGDLVKLWQTIYEQCPGVWLCDGGAYREIGSRMFTPKTFLAMPLPSKSS